MIITAEIPAFTDLPIVLASSRRHAGRREIARVEQLPTRSRLIFHSDAGSD